MLISSLSRWIKRYQPSGDNIIIFLLFLVNVIITVTVFLGWRLFVEYLIDDGSSSLTDELYVQDL